MSQLVSHLYPIGSNRPHLVLANNRMADTQLRMASILAKSFFSATSRLLRGGHKLIPEARAPQREAGSVKEPADREVNHALTKVFPDEYLTKICAHQSQHFSLLYSSYRRAEVQDLNLWRQLLRPQLRAL